MRVRVARRGIEGESLEQSHHARCDRIGEGREKSNPSNCTMNDGRCKGRRLLLSMSLFPVPVQSEGYVVMGNKSPQRSLVTGPDRK